MLSGTEILTTAQMRAIESAAMNSGAVTGLELMQRAGAAVAGQIRLRWPKPGRATILCGPGNNGGDGYVIAQLLTKAGWSVRVLGMDNTPGADAAEMKRQWSKLGPILPLTEHELRSGTDGDVYVDAIFGTGLKRPPGTEIARVLRHLGGVGDDSVRARIVAVDCPSGLCLDSGAVLGENRHSDPAQAPFCAGLTVAFDSPKPGHLLERGPAICGDLIVADIGLHDWRICKDGAGTGTRQPMLEAIWPEFQITDRRRDPAHPGERAAWLTKRGGPAGHKFDHGHAIILAGGPGRGGAARLSARAALRVGAGLVTIGVPAAAMREHSGQPDALMRRVVDGARTLETTLQDRRITALCLGPGCGIERAASLLPAVLSSQRAAVLDADALTAMAQRPLPFEGLHRQVVLTPHAGEFARLYPDLAASLDQTAAHGPAWSRLDAAREAAARCGAIVLLKGPDTVIAAPDGRAIIHSAFDVPRLATAGSGDVLAGLITGLLARGLTPLDAASLGTLIHAKAARRFGPGLIADDLPDQLPAVFRDMSE